jgi:hypothetical protein
MTSVPNRRQPSSGSKHFRFTLLALLLIVTASSCELFKPLDSTRTPPSKRPDRDRADEDLDAVQSRRVFDPETGTYIYVNAPTEPMDTVQWTEVTAEGSEPITDDGSFAYVAPLPGAKDTPGLPPVRQTGVGRNGSRILTGYGVDFVLPFLTDRNSEGAGRIDPNSLWALHFYSGAELAMEELGRDGISYDVRVQDTRASAQKVESIINSPEYQQSQLIIGPYLKPQVTQLAEAVRGQEKVLISPYSAATGITESNTNYIQVNPTLETHLRALLGHAYRSQGADRIVLVAPAGQRSRLAYFQDEYKLLIGDDDGEPLEELIISGQVPDLSQYLRGRRTVFMVPVYEDEVFVSNFLRQAYQNTVQEMGDNIAIYGLPQWRDFERLNADFMEGTNVHVSSSVYIDPLDEDVRSFRRKFYDRFATLPRDEAFVGYDVTRYFLNMAAKYGTRFQFELSRNPEDLMHTSFRFEPVAVIPATATDLEEAVIDRFENKFVNILRYTDYAYKRVN